ncbi:MAG: SHOCT domain-containing protein [Methanobacteriota archaeon]
MDTSEIYSSGILQKNEELIHATFGSLVSKGSGVFLITNKRILLLKRPGMFSKGYSILFFLSLGVITSVSISGFVSKILHVQSGMDIYRFAVGNQQETEIIRTKLIAAKKEFKEKEDTKTKTIQAKTVIVEEAEKESAAEILKKRLARGEITKEEFHDKIQRT